MTTATLSRSPLTERELLARKRLLPAESPSASAVGPSTVGPSTVGPSTVGPSTVGPSTVGQDGSTRDSAATRRARIVIEYCPLANYAPVAEALAAAIAAEFRGCPVETELRAVRGGVYEVSINGRLVFSKRATYRLPDADEVFYHVRVALGKGPTQGPMVPPSG